MQRHICARYILGDKAKHVCQYNINGAYQKYNRTVCCGRENWSGNKQGWITLNSKNKCILWNEVMAGGEKKHTHTHIHTHTSSKSFLLFSNCLTIKANADIEYINIHDLQFLLFSSLRYFWDYLFIYWRLIAPSTVQGHFRAFH